MVSVVCQVHEAVRATVLQAKHAGGIAVAGSCRCRVLDEELVDCVGGRKAVVMAVMLVVVVGVVE